MPAIVTEQQLRDVRNLDFCYLCREPFESDDRTNRDHVPPSAVFAVEDRSPPLILKTHQKCNSGQKDYDEQVGQLVSLLHHSPTTNRINKLKFKLKKVTGSNQPVAQLFDFPLEKIIVRWLKGMHAALYREPLHRDARGKIFGPLPESNTPNSFAPVHPFHKELVATLKKNRFASRTDLLVCRNGKFRYECVWIKRPDDGLDCCVFAIDVYNWLVLGDLHHNEPRSCVGFYLPMAPPPLSATPATKIMFPFPNITPLDAFGA